MTSPRRPLVLLVALLLVSAILPSAVSGQDLVGADHFKCYTIEAAHASPDWLTLQDQFDDYLKTEERVQAADAVLLCNPTTKRLKGTRETAPINHRRDHLTFYAFTPTGQIGWEVLVRNQLFGGQEQRLLVGPAILLAVPTAKRIWDGQVTNPGPIPTDLDHYKCYPVVQGATPNVGAVLRDEFDRYRGTKERVTIQQPRLFCNPVEKIHHLPTGQVTRYPIQHPNLHYVCYGITPPGQGLPFIYQNQLARGNGNATQSVALCVPSQKLQFAPIQQNG